MAAPTAPNYVHRWLWVLGVLSCLFAATSYRTATETPQQQQARLQRAVAPASASAVVQQQSPTPDAAPVPAPHITYLTAKEWRFPTGGVGRNISFDPSPGLTEQKLRDLGDTLRRDTAKFQGVQIMIFTNAQAAKLQPQWAGLKTSKAETALCDRSYVGLYRKNETTGAEGLDCVMDGANGTHFFALDYKRP